MNKEAKRKRDAYLHKGTHIRFRNLGDNQEEYIHVDKTRLKKLKNGKEASFAKSERNGRTLVRIHS